jgi:pyrroline-5-carboxylate reductase
MNILLIGCGRMGSAMARNWAGEHRVLVHDPAANLPTGVERVDALASMALPQNLVVVLAVKPQVFSSLAPVLASLTEHALFLSIMAGVRLSDMEAALGSSRIVRAMPNTPAAIGRGITAAVPGTAVNQADRVAIGALLEATGVLVWPDREGDLDIVTAVSGSGPAYFFRFTEALARAAEAAGLTPELAMQLARETFTGAAALAEREARPLTVLREQVTSPGGTTAAGLAQMDGAIDALAEEVVRAAADRSRALATSTLAE